MQKKEKWVIVSHPGDYSSLGKKYGISPVLARIMRNRGITEEAEAYDYISPFPEKLKENRYSGFNLLDMEKAVEIISGKIDEKKKIRIVGDYDIDGVTSVFILEKGLKKAGGMVDHRIPHRIRDGYGLNKNIIEEAKEAGINTIITCDNGIAAAEEIRLAKEYGMTVVITDHHEVPFEVIKDKKSENLPEADAIVDPKREGDPYSFKSICGAYVAYKFIACFYERRGIDPNETEEFLEIAAFATIGDVMPLRNENRILVKEGLKRLKKTENPGLRALIDLNGLSDKDLSPYHVGFILGPCLNAAGRLDDAENALDLLICEDRDSAHEKAVILKEMNDSRKSLTEKGVKKALDLALSDEYVNDRVLVIFLPDCHESIAGIIAGKVREQTGKPVFILTRGETFDEEPCLKGSGRSIEAYHMFNEMTAVKDLFIRFGGHAMAAGLSLYRENLSELKKRLNENCVLKDEDLVIKVPVDMELPMYYVNLALVEELSGLEPYGTDNEKPLFAARDVKIKDLSILGKSRNVLKGRISDGRAGHDCIYFGSDTEEIKKYIEDRGGENLKVVFSPDINEFRGIKCVQIVIRGVR